ncbi:aminoacyl--tRNA ligase-related protein [Cohnella yongneupensis]|uniref:Aminoacyl--tRNA ligase-related protein n=1 Tax=Cohnella yongneupensis TaxID=425006 RepID=A0ABW0R6G0_9BACL
MATTFVELKVDNSEVLKQLVYAAFFVDENIQDIQAGDNGLTIVHADGADAEKITEQVHKLHRRFSNHEYAFKQEIYFENRVDVPYRGPIIQEMADQKIIKQLDPGVYIFREPFTTLVRFLDDSIVRKIANKFGAKHEYYPVVINGSTLNKTNHFTSFPEHIQFVTHLREDLSVIEAFSQAIKEAGGWNQDTRVDMNASAATPQYMINPATCYHCYEGMQDETLETEGTIVTAVSKCHRYEGGNHRDFGRLLDFTMREVIFVGKPDFVKENRLKSIEMLKGLVSEWELDCHLENANDPFFTSDYEVKASFQRQQEMKFEMRMSIPYLNTTISVSSSNFHSNTFGNAFNIKAGKRPAVTGCLAFGLERFILAFLAQYGLDESKWPAKFTSDYNEWKQTNER